MKITAQKVEIAVANLLNYRVYSIVPNVSWGLGLYHECDMLALDKKGRFTEIEIKISASDLKADFKKKHGHQSSIISRLVYAIPDDFIGKYDDLIPPQCGIITFSEWKPGLLRAKWHRGCKHVKGKSPSQQEILDFYRLGAMRIWTLKKHLAASARMAGTKN